LSVVGSPYVFFDDEDLDDSDRWGDSEDDPSAA